MAKKKKPKSPIKGGKAGRKQYDAMRKSGASKQIAAATVNKRFGKGKK